MTLRQLPLLRGASQARLEEVAGRMKLHFFKGAEGETVLMPGQACGALVFVISGSVRLTMSGGDGEFEIGQTLAAPQLISPDCLFGYDTTYPCRVTALTSASFMEINKEDFRRMLAMDSVFLFNYLNTICTGAQRGRHGLMSIAAGSATERLAYWVTTLTQPGATDIIIRSSERELHSVLGISAAGMRSAIDRLVPKAIAPDAYTLQLTERDFLLPLL
ncbi:MAG: Crp/Fnr family transcriptional regulator [Bacteroides sp.]|nr:Crp/Fnr family transcriptional regulator [Bacteroides sp.]MCM1379452.1 Crp/Fnr family transcriptional regulator [Bacteroides sp.]MCM1445313.1 Crp/Fnr family transcriptional regulator [Prevotella sp.]